MLWRAAGCEVLIHRSIHPSVPITAGLAAAEAGGWAEGASQGSGAPPEEEATPHQPFWHGAEPPKASQQACSPGPDSAQVAEEAPLPRGRHEATTPLPAGVWQQPHHTRRCLQPQVGVHEECSL